MSCAHVRSSLSALRDGDLSVAESRAVSAHLEQCGPCAVYERDWSGALDGLSGLSRLHPEETIASAVLNRLELENRGPGLALLFRPLSAARPLILPSLIPAFTIVAALFGLLIAVSKGTVAPPPSQAWDASYPASGTEANPLPPTSGISAPRVQGVAVLSDSLLSGMGNETLFLETVVARDGSVSAVNLLGGDSVAAAPVVEALRRERFLPGRLHGRPVAVSVYRLISRMDVRAPLT